MKRSGEGEVHIALNVDVKYHRDQFDDWLAGGDFYYRGRRYYWVAQNSNYDFGWEVEPIMEDDWNEISENVTDRIIRSVEKCLWKTSVTQETLLIKIG